MIPEGRCKPKKPPEIRSSGFFSLPAGRGRAPSAVRPGGTGRRTPPGGAGHDHDHREGEIRRDQQDRGLEDEDQPHHRQCPGRNQRPFHPFPVVAGFIDAHRNQRKHTKGGRQTQEEDGGGRGTLQFLREATMTAR